MPEQQHIINDVTGLNPISVWAIAKPTTIEEIQDAIRRTNGPISIGGGRFSMGGQTASPGSLHLDMRSFNQVVEFSPLRRTIRVQTGIRWCDIQKFIDPHNLSIKIMQTYANFTVGGSLSVNVHGRYIGLGPLILSVRAIAMVLANGDLVEASPTQNPELFYGAIGGYGGLGVIVEAELELAENKRVERISVKLPASEYAAYFRKFVRDSRETVFHNADLYPPHHTKARCETWIETKKPVTTPYRLQPHKRAYPLENYFLWAITETPFGKWRREYLIDPLVYLRTKVHWRNFEAGYDAAMLEPPSRKHRTYVLQEYFVPVERFDEFVPKMAEILSRHRVNALNVSVRHAHADPGSMLAWARQETFAFVLYYKQRTRENAKNRVGVWTRELIDAALSVGGAYYLPYQAHATPEQFHQAFPRAKELFALKRKLDPECRFRNVLWDKYYVPTLQPEANAEAPVSEFHSVFSEVKWHDGFYRFLQNIFRLYPEDRFHTLIKEACVLHQSDEAIYRHVQQKLPTIKPMLADFSYALPSLKKQKQEMMRQTLGLLGDKRDIDGYVEIGTTGRYVSTLRKHLRFRGPMILLHDVPPSNSPVDIIERGQLGKLGTWVSLENYAPISSTIADNSMDLVTCYVGLHHMEPEKLAPFLRSIHRILRPGGIFIVRDHDVSSPEMNAFVSLAHTVFNAGLGASWDVNQQELRFFASVKDWVQRLESAGFQDTGHRLLQANDPSDNVLMAFRKLQEFAQ
ncbi:MAG TPA: FAD-binding protein [Blastocatellia bacterium]|nr:FAD-binding protein [Blastocatellia bacterium]